MARTISDKYNKLTKEGTVVYNGNQIKAYIRPKTITNVKAEKIANKVTQIRKENPDIRAGRLIDGYVNNPNLFEKRYGKI